MFEDRTALCQPDYGRRILPNLIDERAAAGHSRPYAAIPLTKDPRDGFQEISYSTFANAINRCARWLIEEIGTSKTCEVLVYMGPQDLRYQILCIAAIKTGRVMFFTSPRNSMEAHVSLLNESNASYFITANEEPPIVASILKEKQLPKLIVLPLNELLNETKVQPVNRHLTFEQHRMEPFLLLHTSGSTGIPKIIVLRHGYTTSMDAYSRFDGGSEIVQRTGNKRIFNPFPPFHMAGIMWSLPIVCWVDSTIVCLPNTPLTAEIANSIHEVGQVNYSTLPHSVVIELAKNPAYLQNIQKLEGLSFAGGPLPENAGEQISKLTTIHSSYGSTEMMAPPVRSKTRENWQYLRFDIEHSGIEFRKTGSDTYELVIVRKPELDLVQAIFVTFPELREYHTKDLFSRHPNKQDHWLYAGRLDDIIVFSNGEKFNPVSMEGAITAGCPEVKGCLVVGQGEFHGALIVEAKDLPETESAKKSLIDKIWPVVQKANKDAIRPGQISKDFIMLTTPEKPLPRAGKGTIQRQRAVDLYKQEIENFYSSSKSGARHMAKDSQQIEMNSLEATQKSLQRFIVAEIDIENIPIDQDIFQYGIDSLQAMSLTRAINASLPLDQFQIEVKQVYENPTIRKLAASLHHSTTLQKEDDDDIETWIEMQQMFHDVKLSVRFQRDFQQPITKEKHGDVEKGMASSLPTYEAALDEKFLNSMVPPDSGVTAWLQVLASCLINFNTFGLVNSFGDYQAFYQTEYLSSYSNFEISWIGTLQAALLLIIGVFSGPLFDKGYFRITLIISSITLVFAQMMLSISTRYYEIMLTQGVLTGICVGLLYIPSVALVPFYFRNRRGLALGLALSGAAIGGIIYPIVFRSLLNSTGFGWATRAIGFLALFTLTVAAILVQPMDQLRKPAREFFDLGALKEVPFTAWIIGSFLAYNAWLIPYFLTPAFSLSVGTSQNTAYYLLAVLNAAQLLGRVFSGYLSDIIGGEFLLLAAQILAGVLGLSWITVTTVGGWIEIQIFYGIVSGMIATLPAVVVPYVCPSLAVLGTRMGMIYASAGIGILIGNPVALALSSPEKGQFLGAQLWMGLLALAGAGFFVVTAMVATRRRKGIEKTKTDKPTFTTDWEEFSKTVVGKIRR